MKNKKLEIVFNYLDTDNKLIRSYEVHPLYEEVRNTFDSYLSTPIKMVRKYTDTNIHGEFDMVELKLTYELDEDNITHTECLIKLLENLDMDLQFNIIGAN